MPDLTISTADSSECECGATVPLDIHVCPECDTNMYRLPFGEFFSNLERGLLMDARYGGLVLGRKTREDDIPMYAPIGSGLFRLKGLMQGGEYILSRAASVIYKDRVAEINAEKGEDDLSEIIHPCRSVIDTNFMPQYGGIWIVEGQFIINRFATRKYIETLDHLNAEANEAVAQDPTNYHL